MKLLLFLLSILVAQQTNIEDPYKNMVPFKKALYKNKKIRIAYISDSNNAMDYASYYLRTYLGATFGYGGHGYILAGKPLPWYQHRDIRTKNKNGWKTYQVTTPKTKVYPYGIGGGVGVGKLKGSYVQFYSARKGPNSLFSTITIHYICTPPRNGFDVLLDNKNILNIENECSTLSYRTYKIKVKLKRHVLKIVTVKPPVVITGVSFERDRGVVVDGIGISGASIWHISILNKKIFSSGLKSRKYNLVILHLGTNLTPSLIPHYKWLKIVVTRIRNAIGPKVSILIISPPPRGKRVNGQIYPHYWPYFVAKEKQQYAKRLKCAYWDYMKAAGGPSSIVRWYRKKWFYYDLIHSRPPFQRYMTKLLFNSLMN